MIIQIELLGFEHPPLGVLMHDIGDLTERIENWRKNAAPQMSLKVTLSGKDPVKEIPIDTSKEPLFLKNDVALALDAGNYEVQYYDNQTFQWKHVGVFSLDEARVWRYDVHDFSVFDEEGNPQVFKIGVATQVGESWYIETPNNAGRVLIEPIKRKA